MSTGRRSPGITATDRAAVEQILTEVTRSRWARRAVVVRHPLHDAPGRPASPKRTTFRRRRLHRHRRHHGLRHPVRCPRRSRRTWAGWNTWPRRFSSSTLDSRPWLLGWSVSNPTNDYDDDDNVMTSLPTTGTTGTTDNHNRQQQRLVEQRLGVLDHCARTGVEQASHAYLAYIGTVHQLNLAINQEVC